MRSEVQKGFRLSSLPRPLSVDIFCAGRLRAFFGGVFARLECCETVVGSVVGTVVGTVVGSAVW